MGTVQTVMPPPLPRKNMGSPVTSRVRAQKSQSPRAKKVELQQQAAFLATAGPVTLNATSVHNIVCADTEDFASGVLANVKDAVTPQTISVVAAALREGRQRDVAARLKRQEEKTKKKEDKVELALAEQARLLEAKERAEATAKEAQNKLTTSSAEVARLRSERDSL